MSEAERSEPTAAELADVAWSARDDAGRRGMLAGILAEVSLEALRGDTLDAVLRGIVDCLTRNLPVAIASIILVDDDASHFIREVWSGELNLELPTGEAWPTTTGAAGRCVRTGCAQLIADTASDPDYVSGNPRVRSEYLVPIRHRERLHGVLNLESTRSDFFSPAVCAMFDAVAAQVAGVVHLARVVDELEAANRRLEVLSMSDGLTGIANRRCFDERLDEEWCRHAADAQPLALLLVDVDFFKALNDARGHLHGDECLRVLSRLCSESTAAGSELVARYGGEEFALLLPRCDADEALHRGEDLRTRVQGLAIAHPQSGVADCLTVSIGASAVVPHAGCAPERLIEAADRALSVAKHGGRNRVELREPFG